MDNAGRRSSPFRAILWKEWRESWWLLALLLLAPIAAPLFHLRVIWLVQGVLAALLGARCFAAESADGTAFFQSERPLTRQRLWTAHIVLPLCAVTASFLLRVVVELSTRDLPASIPAIQLTAGGCALALLFASTLFAGAILDRPVTAFAAGIVLVVLEGFLLLGFADVVFDRLFPGMMPEAWQLVIMASCLGGRNDCRVPVSQSPSLRATVGGQDLVALRPA